MSGSTTTQIEHWLAMLRLGKENARPELIRHAADRLRRLAGTMLSRFPALRRWEQSDDVFQSAMLRLHRALAGIAPQSARHFYNLAALEIRRELLDLAKHYFGPHGPAAKYQSDAAILQHARGADGSALMEWSDVHESVEELPDAEKEVVNLLFYQGLTREEAASVLGVAVRTVNRRWRSARLLLHEALRGNRPGA